jgi:hypothetical protein
MRFGLSSTQSSSSDKVGALSLRKTTTAMATLDIGDNHNHDGDHEDEATEGSSERKRTGRDVFASFRSSGVKAGTDDGSASVVFCFYQLAVLVVPQGGYSVLATRAAQVLTGAAKFCSLNHLPGLGDHGVCIRRGMSGLDKVLIDLTSPVLVLVWLSLLVIAVAMVVVSRRPAFRSEASYGSVDSRNEERSQGLLTSSDDGRGAADR